MTGRADMISNRRHVQRALQAVGFVALLLLAVGAVLTAGGAFAGGLTASSVKPAHAAHAPILTDTKREWFQVKPICARWRKSSKFPTAHCLT